MSFFLPLAPSVECSLNTKAKKSLGILWSCCHWEAPPKLSKKLCKAEELFRKFQETTCWEPSGIFWKGAKAPGSLSEFLKALGSLRCSASLVCSQSVLPRGEDRLTKPIDVVAQQLNHPP